MVSLSDDQMAHGGSSHQIPPGSGLYVGPKKASTASFNSKPKALKRA